MRDGGGPGGYATTIPYAVRVMYYHRFVYDISYWLIVNVIYMNIIFGIILDTFAGTFQEKCICNEYVFRFEG